jgi:hypothetical protein
VFRIAMFLKNASDVSKMQPVWAMSRENVLASFDNSPVDNFSRRSKTGEEAKMEKMQNRSHVQLYVVPPHQLVPARSIDLEAVPPHFNKMNGVSKRRICRNRPILFTLSLGETIMIKVVITLYRCVPHVPGTMYHVPYTMYHVEFWFFHGLHLALSISTMARRTFHGLHLALFISTPCTRYHVPGTMYEVPCSVLDLLRITFNCFHYYFMDYVQYYFTEHPLVCTILVI